MRVFAVEFLEETAYAVRCNVKPWQQRLLAAPVVSCHARQLHPSLFNLQHLRNTVVLPMNPAEVVADLKWVVGVVGLICCHFDDSLGSVLIAQGCFEASRSIAA